MLGRSLAPLTLASLALTFACTSPTPAPSEASQAQPKAAPAPADEPKLAQAEPVESKPTASTPSEPQPTQVEPSEPAPTEPLPTPPVGPSDLVPLPFYWGQLREGKVEIDAHDVSESEYEPIAALEFEDTLVLERGDARIPGRFAHDQPFVLVSEAGRVKAKVEKVTLIMGDGISMSVTLAPESPLEASQGVVVFSPSTAPSDAKVRLPLRLAEADPAFTKLLASVNSALKKASLAKAKASELQVHAVTMQNEVRFVVTVQVFDGKDPDEVDSSEVATGLALADASGKIVQWIRPLELDMEVHEVQLALDLDADGFDELVFRSTYSEGSFSHLLRLDPKQANQYASLEIAGAGL